ncbi:SdrD B-like domain-containing protein [Botrimarina sp.]|uniref:SdrD B-like domain-containing protein n=1 Tax=Botrimarina sp. TaxID=2795802 RepID=UPI0032EC90C4
MRRRRGSSTRRRLRACEALEHRRVLATDLGQIAGAVLNDLDGDGAGDTAAVSQQLELFLDDGDGLFDAGDASQAVTTTDAAGAYSFDNLVAGTYFVRINPTAGTQAASGGSVSSAITFTPAQAMGTTNITVDDFTAVQDVTATRGMGDPGAVSNSGTVDAGSIAGGEQDLFVEVTDGLGDVRGRSGFNNGAAMVLSLASDSGVNGRLVATWDGDDNDGAAVSHTGLSLDLLQSGVNSAFALNLAADQVDGTLILRAFSGAGNVSEATIELTDVDGLGTPVDTDGTIDGDAAEAVSVAFADFSTTAGSGADFSSLTALQLELDFTDPGENGLDAEVEVLGVVGFTTQTANFTVLDELSLGDRVFLDADNDGLFDAGESGVAGVALTLFEDTDNDGDHLDEVAVDTTTTDANGLYLFAGLLPGDYIVRVDASNFGASGPLEGLATSTGNDVGGLPPDPNSDEDNNQDRGFAAGDGSVVSLPVTLVSGAEPTDDGDTDPLTNRTIDFGFFGFDVVVSKSVDGASAVPGATLEYEIVVTNDGPSTATGVTLADTLPTGVTYVSGATTVSGQSVNGSAGSPTVTSTIGTLAAGASATVTINVSVDPSATGTLTNTAVIAATDEANTTNNTATAATTVVPQIDLAITKTDDDAGATLAPGDTVTYTLQVTNNGPSAATGVTVTDLLPSGATFAPAGSTSPAATASVAGGTQLTYNLGSLASGADASITIVATIDASFTGTLTNTATVAGNESETIVANNTAAAQTSAAVPLGTISGRVFLDVDGDNVQDPSDPGIAGVVLSLFNSADTLIAVTTTDSNGDYAFTNVVPGAYRVVQTQPAPFTDLDETSGTAGAVVGAVENEISNIQVNAGGLGDTAPQNNFTEGPPNIGKRSFFASTIFGPVS